MDTHTTQQEERPTPIDWRRRYITVVVVVGVVLLLTLGFISGYFFRDNYVVQHVHVATTSR